MTPAEAEAHSWRQDLPPHPDEHRTGAVWLDYDPRDYKAMWLPGVAAHAILGPTADISLVPLVKEPRLNQGSEGSCVAGSTDGYCQMAHSAVDGTWPAYSIHELYAEAGGQGSNGVDVRTVMKICIDKGTPLAAGGRDSLIKSYVFVSQQVGAFRTEVKAALAAGHPVLIASLLPIPFGWNSGETLSSAYHQYLGIGVMTDAAGKEWVIILNDWTDSWPGDAPAGTPGGIGRISFDCLEQNNLQNGYTYAVIPTTALVTPPVPTPIPTPAPVPPRAATVTGRAVAGPTNGIWPNVGATLPFGQDVMLTVSTIQFDGTPTPTPDPQPNPQPNPGGLTVTVPTKRYSASMLGIWAYASDSGKPVLAHFSGSAGPVILEPRTGSPAVWILRGAQATGPISITINATADDGRTGTGTASV